MSRFWLDAARYGDTHGLHLDNYREMWPYRDWVVRAFNSNMPFDRFTTEQLAGDLLPDATDSQLLATTFDRLHPQKVEGGTVPEEFRVEYVADRTHTFATAFLGLTLECARCHDHKFDPIPQRDYYKMLATFFPFVKYEFPLAPPEAVEEFEARKAEIDAEIKPLKEKISDLEAPYRA